MFSWICPKCGKEVPPAYNECPHCAAKEPQGASESAPAAAPPPPAPSPAATQPVRKGTSAAHGWLYSLLFAAVFIVIGLTVYVLLRPKAETTSTSQQQPAALPNPAAAPAPAAGSSGTAFRGVEVTGLRLTEDAKQKPFLQLVIVNHTAGDLGDITASGNVKAVNAKNEQEEVGTFSVRARLGPYEAKDVKVPLETKLRVYEFPDWQFLKAELKPTK